MKNSFARLYVRPVSFSAEAPPYVEIPDLLYAGGGGRLSKTLYFDMKAGTYDLDISYSDLYTGTYSFVLEFESAHEEEHYNCYHFKMKRDGFVDIDLASWVPENDHGAEQYLPSLKYELEIWNRENTDSESVFHRIADTQYHDRLFLQKGNYTVAVSTTQGNFTLKVSLPNCQPVKMKTDKKQYLYPADSKILTKITFSDGKTVKYCNEFNYSGSDNAWQYGGVSRESGQADVLNVNKEEFLEILQTGKAGKAKLTAYAAGNRSVKTACNVIVCFDDVKKTASGRKAAAQGDRSSPFCIGTRSEENESNPPKSFVRIYTFVKFQFCLKNNDG